MFRERWPAETSPGRTHAVKGGHFQPVHLFTRHKLRAGWGLPTAFPLLLGLLTPSSEAVGDPWNGGRSGWVGPAWPSGKLGGGLPCPPGLSPPPPPGPGWVSSLSHRVPVCWWSQGRWAGAGPDQMVCQALSVGSGEVGGGMEDLLHKACSVSPGSCALGIAVCLPAPPRTSHPQLQKPHMPGPPALLL